MKALTVSQKRLHPAAGNSDDSGYDSLDEVFKRQKGKICFLKDLVGPNADQKHGGFGNKRGQVGKGGRFGNAKGDFK